MTIEDVLKKRLDLRERKAELAKKQAEEMKPLNEAEDAIDNWLMHQMNTLGVTQLKAEGVATAFKSTQTSVQMQDAQEFKKFVFQPVLEHVLTYFQNAGYPVRDVDYQSVGNIIRDLVRWDVVDFRAGKKGIQEYIELEKLPVPGVAVNSIATVSIRKA